MILNEKHIPFVFFSPITRSQKNKQTAIFSEIMKYIEPSIQPQNLPSHKIVIPMYLTPQTEKFSTVKLNHLDNFSLVFFLKCNTINC